MAAVMAVTGAKTASILNNTNSKVIINNNNLTTDNNHTTVHQVAIQGK